MKRIVILSSAMAMLLGLASRLVAADPQKDRPRRAEQDSMALADKIDELIAAQWKAKSITPAAPADDAEFLRRVFLDLTGRIPSITDVSDFLGNPAKDKRQQLVRMLLANDRYAPHEAAVWRSIVLKQSTNQQFAVFTAGFDAYLASQFKSRTGFDKIVRDIIESSPQSAGAASLFYQANENKTENLAAASSRLFLGVKIECAQCHNHPFAKWKREQFWEFASFFSGTETGQFTGKPAALGIPGTGKTVEARFLDGTEPSWDKNPNRRAVLSQWLTSKDNPWFSRAIANRVWESLMGTGLVEPVDDFNADNEPSHPELLDELARQFADHDFDVTYLVEAIVLSKTYQRTSELSDPSQKDPRVFARMPVRGMSAEQLFDSLAMATGRSDELSATKYGFPATPLQTARAEFLGRFPDQDRRTEIQTSILQALYYMNGKITGEATTLEKNKNLNAIANARESVGRERRIAELYLISLSRKPKSEETKRFMEYLEAAAADGNEKQAYCDIFWALLNSTEFFFNH